MTCPVFEDEALASILGYERRDVEMK